jgi:hypothetical protein
MASAMNNKIGSRGPWNQTLGFQVAMDHYEIAAAMGISRRNVQRHEARALAKARKILEARGFCLEDFLPVLGDEE